MGAVLIGFSLWNQPSKEELEALHRQKDSIALVERTKDSIKTYQLKQQQHQQQVGKKYWYHAGHASSYEQREIMPGSSPWSLVTSDFAPNGLGFYLWEKLEDAIQKKCAIER